MQSCAQNEFSVWQKRRSAQRATRMGRPSKRSDAVRASFLFALRVTGSITISADFVHVTPRFIADWRRADPDFAAAVIAGLTHFEERMLAIVSHAALDHGDPAACLWLLRNLRTEKLSLKRRRRRLELVTA